MTPFFHLHFELYLLVYFISRPSRISSMGSLPLHYILVCKIHIDMPQMTFSSLLTQVSFFYKKFAVLVTCFFPYLIPIWPRSQNSRELHFLSVLSIQSKEGSQVRKEIFFPCLFYSKRSICCCTLENKYTNERIKLCQ